MPENKQLFPTPYDHQEITKANIEPDRPLDRTEWKQIASSLEFKSLVHDRRKFILPATIFFIVYYFALPVLVGYAPGLMSKKVIGPLNAAYLFALSQFFMAWIIAALYVRAAGRHDQMIRKILSVDRTENESVLQRGGR
jgi:uncharacterized membrane protein (DUF485 family)